jgi:hypothetical protein
MQRRWFIQGVLVGGAAVVATTQAREAIASPISSPHAVSGAPEPEAKDLPPAPRAPAAAENESLWPLLAPLTPGAEVARGWKIREVSVISDGGACATLVSDHGEARVHVCRHDGNDERAMTHSTELDLYLMNGGDGLAPTDETLAGAVETLALVLARNEVAGVEVPDALMTHSARLNFFARDRKLL